MFTGRDISFAFARMARPAINAIVGMILLCGFAAGFIAATRAMTELVRGERMERGRRFRAEKNNRASAVAFVAARSDREIDGLNGPVRSVTKKLATVARGAEPYSESSPEILSRTTYNRNGSRRAEFEFENGTLARRWEYVARGDALLEIDGYDDRNRPDGRVTMRYDSLHRLIERIAYNRSGAVDSTTIYAYDSTGRLFESRDFRERDFARCGRRYILNGEGRLVRLEIYRAVMAKSPDSTIRYRYDSIGNRIEECRYGASRAPVETIMDDYDVRGRHVARRVYNSVGGTIPVEEWQYAFDRFGNAIRAEMFKWKEGSERAIPIPAMVLYSDIEYY